MVFVLADDLDASLLRFMPQLQERVVSRGVTLENAIYPLAVCCPSRSSILRGQYVHNHGMWHTLGEYAGWPLFQRLGHENSTVATWLNRTGYRTLYVGKYMNGYANTTRVPPGWDDWHGYLGSPATNPYRVNENGIIRSYRRRTLDTDLFAQKAEEFIRRSDAEADGEPFFAFVATNAPHGPSWTPKRYADLYRNLELPKGPGFDEADTSDKSAWVRDKPHLSASRVSEMTYKYQKKARSVKAVDDLVGRVLDTLAATGELENTHFIFWSDNGFHMGEHRLAWAKHTPYEEDIRVPMFVRGPGVPEGATREQLVSGIDLAPTFAQIAGVGTPSFMDGRTTLPLLGANPPTSWRDAVLVESKATGSREPPYGMPGYSALRTPELAYVEWNTGEKELYDLATDPYQLENVYAKADSILKEQLGTRLDALKRCGGETCREIEGP